MGKLFTVTTVVALALHPFAVIVKLYVPDLFEVVPVIVGFCSVEVKPSGPVHK